MDVATLKKMSSVFKFVFHNLASLSFLAATMFDYFWFIITYLVFFYLRKLLI